MLKFQSTRPRGARRYLRCQVPRVAVVSIHAPARGATGQVTALALNISGFNPRARAGRDGTPSRSRLLAGGFNPRARAGRDAMSKAPCP